jgi:hypothetical protein
MLPGDSFAVGATAAFFASYRKPQQNASPIDPSLRSPIEADLNLREVACGPLPPQTISFGWFSCVWLAVFFRTKLYVHIASCRNPNSAEPA